jgi:predicted nucleic acid-binding protein
LILLADTSGLIAYFDADTPEHQDCRRILDEVALVVVSPMVLTELDHLARRRFGDHARDQILDFVFDQVERIRFAVPEIRPEILAAARAVLKQYRGLSLDLADAVTVALADEYDTNRVFTLDRKDFRAMRPLAGGAFMLLPDDAE